MCLKLDASVSISKFYRVGAVIVSCVRVGQRDWITANFKKNDDS